ncbi:SMI1/KNR4 family protein [Myxococcus qinghaiensis]|uniref:SMI1/KNR4 family protein n=1 Tax=Myxococcus qinghaiensis TaxID=2906758 RepID=UPI0020A7734D|nr:SMI1/KNR4 family protein [Myxococcus qinghaiensis]MCP3168200.1 SMI1/KNR4 family protein [Myxococcus qinghaiensis]
MGGKTRPPALGGLAAAFQKAGLATKEQAERAEAEKQALAQKDSRAALGPTGPALDGKSSYQEQISSVNAWFAEHLRSAPDLAARLAGERTQAVVIEGVPATRAELEAAERELGFALPPSFAAFLLEVGSVSFLNPWLDATTSVRRVVAASASLEADVALTAERFLQASAAEGLTLASKAPRHLLHVGEEQGAEAVFALCSRRDAAGEAPVFLRHHDEPDVLYHPASHFRQWFSERLIRLKEELQLR